jgi:hypothetical protein
MTALVPDHSQIIGWYVNGEYSTGERRSIGYHNLSQVNAVIANRSVRELPEWLNNTRRVRDGITVFISHAKRDRATVREIVGHMHDRVGTILDWFDEDQLLAGAHLQNEIRSAITARSNYFLVFLSRFTVESAWVRDELSWAAEHEARRGSEFVIPVMLDDVWEPIKASWPSGLVAFLEPKRRATCGDHSEDGIITFSRRVAGDIERWAARVRNR